MGNYICCCNKDRFEKKEFVKFVPLLQRLSKEGHNMKVQIEGDLMHRILLTFFNLCDETLVFESDIQVVHAKLWYEIQTNESCCIILPITSDADQLFSALCLIGRGWYYLKTSQVAIFDGTNSKTMFTHVFVRASFVKKLQDMGILNKICNTKMEKTVFFLR